jgi:hypothetical protein
MGTLVVITAGLDRILLASMVRSFRVVPLGTFALAPARRRSPSCAPREESFWPRRAGRAGAGGTMLVEIAVALLGKLSPQLPVMSLTVPLKTLTGFVILTGLAGSLAALYRGALRGPARHGRAADCGAGRGATGWEASRCPESAPNRPRSTAARRRARKATCCTAASFRPRQERWPG